MKKIMLGAVALAAIGAAPALAADLYTKAPAIVPAAVYNWTGFYVGGELGGAWSKSYGSFVFPPPATYTNSNSTAIGGGFVGYQYQWNKVVLGIEANVVALFNSNLGSSSCIPSNCGGVLTGNTLGSAIWSVGPRLGWAAGVWMPYVTGGYAGTRLNQSVSNGFDAPFTQNRTGWYLGGGGDWAVNTNWIIGVEYRHYDFGTSRTVPLLATGGPDPGDTVDLNLKSDTVAARVSYKFGGPVVAKY